MDNFWKIFKKGQLKLYLHLSFLKHIYCKKVIFRNFIAFFSECDQDVSRVKTQDIARTSDFIQNIVQRQFNPFQPSVAFHIETSHFFCSAKQMTGFYMKRNTGLKQVNPFLPNILF